MSRLLNIDEVAGLLGLRPKTIYALVCRRQIPHVKLSPGKGGALRFEEAAIQKYIEARRVPASV